MFKDEEELIEKKDFETLAIVLKRRGLKDLSRMATVTAKALPYLKDEDEEGLAILRFLSRYQKTMAERKKSLRSPDKFNSLKDAMKFFTVRKLEGGEEGGSAEKEDIKYLLLKPKTKVFPINPLELAGIMQSDIIVIGYSQRVVQALEGYGYAHDMFSHSQLILRNVTLLGIRRDSLFVDSLVNVDKNKAKKDKVVSGKVLISSIVKMVDSAGKKFEGKKVASKQVRLFKGHYYFLLLPPTVTQRPFCPQKYGRVLPIIHEWEILAT